MIEQNTEEWESIGKIGHLDFAEKYKNARLLAVVLLDEENNVILAQPND